MTFATSDFDFPSGIRKPHLLSLATSEGWIESGGNILIFGQRGTGKTHVIAAIGPHRCRSPRPVFHNHRYGPEGSLNAADEFARRRSAGASRPSRCPSDNYNSDSRWPVARQPIR
ncbi:ATP-binding protein [Mesorhizobium sp. VK2D]|nr:ATP-binding protein [Mesorhizobium sp. VK2D]MDX8462469.1 ATP-binding protein [Mesorhizobium sp. VK2D]